MDIRGFLIDLDGTLYDGETAVPGAPEALACLRRRAIPFLLVTNTTRMPRRDILARLRRLRFDVEEREVFPVPDAAIQYLQARKPGARCFLIGATTLDEEFRAAGIQVVREEQPVDFVVLSQYSWIHFGEIGVAFRLVQAGAEPVTMHRDMTYPEGGKLHASLGGAVMVLEALTRVPVTVIGKPNPRFFELALRHAGLDKAGTVMIGDNYDGDVRGAIGAGLRAILVQTGGYDARAVSEGDVRPTWLLASIGDLPAWLERVAARSS
ncbi:MAG: HAD-IIA family hydrolase [Planctomycetes bacterium]|nr:HAD-IIA family hydrolase [Planctomycetota bacterium]